MLSNGIANICQRSYYAPIDRSWFPLPTSWNLKVQSVVHTEERIETAQESRKCLSEAVRETTEA